MMTRQDVGSTTTRSTREQAVQQALKRFEEREKELAQEQLRGMRLWEGKAERQDKVLLALFIGLPLIMMLTIPLRPLFIADHPVALAFATGSYAAIGAGAAFAAVGQGTLWLVILAGVVGKIKVSWLFWWLGRRWGVRFIRFTVPNERAQRFAARLQSMNPWVLRVLIPLGYLPGVPTMIVCVLAGTSGMRLRTYLFLDALGALMVTSIVAFIGFTSGQTGVDVVLLVDKYALWIMLALIFGMSTYPVYTSIRDQKARKAETIRAAEAEYDAQTTRPAAEGATATSTEAKTDDPTTRINTSEDGDK
ncbi:VTT domain-containing protein [Nocardiopsis alkaliphila]|uniref:VTT domain-containing protein n=1 Tax=Nocardiopsis alkaliphila TaxID=225762 RepID=UPI00037F8CF3|nr:VTT domain-containing protein [Nocardiopsis alkaliphila]